MLEVLIWSLLLGSLGIESVLVSAWLRWQQKVVKTQNEEEEQMLPNDRTQDKQTGEQLSSATSVREAKRSRLGKSPKRLKSSSLSRPNRTRPQPSRPSPTPVAKKISANKGEASDKARSQPETVLNHSSPSNSNPETLTPTQTVVNGFNEVETIEPPRPIYFTDPEIVEWEYKIVRAHYDLFRNSTNFMRLCEEESQAGWILLEKLDDRRVRFKRSIAMRDRVDVNQLSFDPYRCHYGPSNKWLNCIGAIAAVTAMVLPAYLGYTLVSHTLQESTTRNSWEQLNPEFQSPQVP